MACHVVCLALLCATRPALAQENPDGGSLAGELDAAGPRLWKIDSATSTVYLFGSIHLATPQMYPLPEKVDAAFDDAEQLVVEVDSGLEEQAQMGQMMVASGSYPPGESLCDHVSEDVHRRLADYLRGAGIPADAFDRFEPWLVALTVSVMELQRLGFDAALGLDVHFLARARGVKPILQLESVEEQLSLFDGLCAELQEALLKKTLIEIDLLGDQANEMIDAWSAGDAAALQALIYRSLEEAPELAPLFERLFTERNLAMTEKIVGYLGTESSYFVLVGAGHLVGDDGIVALLQARGFPVESVRRERLTPAGR